jgi:DNA invertase Pin-like site-specific DNA recombinase
LGRDTRDVIATVYDLADLGITVIPVKSETGPIRSTMGKLLWAIQAWYAEVENSEKSEVVKAGQAGARPGGKHMGRPRRVFDRREVVRLRDVERLSWLEIARPTGAGVGTVVQAYRDSAARRLSESLVPALAAASRIQRRFRSVPEQKQKMQPQRQPLRRRLPKQWRRRRWRSPDTAR